MIDPRKPSQLAELHDAIKESNSRMDGFRSNYKDLLTQYVGARYSDSAAEHENPLNLLEAATTIYMQALAAKPPQVTVRTKQRRYRSAAIKLEALVNQELENPNIMHAIQRAVIASLMGMGIVKVGIRPAGVVSVFGEDMPGTAPFVEPILLENWVQDMSASSLEEADYYGHCMELRLEDIQRNPDYDPKVSAFIRPDSEQGDDSEKLNTLSGDTRKTRVGKWAKLWEVYLRRERLVVTYSADQIKLGPLSVKQWEGPAHGPCHCLFYNDVEGNSMPLAPALTWAPLHDMVNSALRKLNRQAERQKTVGVVTADNEKDAQALMEARDGEVVSVADVNGIQERMYGGINQQTFAFMLQLKQLFSWHAGNLDTLGGLASMSNTATQDQILNANSSARLTWMADRVALFTKRVLTDYAFWLWTDPAVPYEVTLQSPMGPMPTVLQPDERGYDFYVNELEIEPYSMTNAPPSAKLQQVNTLMTQVLLPMAPMLMQQGVNINVPGYLQTVAKYANLPEVADLVTVNGAPLQVDGPDVSKRQSSPVKVSTENRVSRGAGGMQGDETSMIQQMMSAPQPQQQSQQ